LFRPDCSPPAPSLHPPQTVTSVDLARYAGPWREVESFLNWFQGGCGDIKAEYTPRPDGSIRVVDTCQRGGRPIRIAGTARVFPGSNNSKLKVRFFWPFEGDYWVLNLDPAYRWAAVGHPQPLPPRPKSYDVNRLRPTPFSEQD